MQQIQALLSTSGGDVTEPPLLLELLAILERSRVRHKPFFQTDDEDDGELEPLGLMHGDQRNEVLIARQIVGRRDQGYFFQEGRELHIAGKSGVLAGDGAQLEYVLPAIFTIL